MVLGRVLILCLFGRLGERPDASVNPLGTISFRVAEQQAGVVDIGDFRGRLGANVAELELTDPAGRDLVADGDCLPPRL